MPAATRGSPSLLGGRSPWAAAAIELLAVLILLPLVVSALSSLTTSAGTRALAHWWAGPRGWQALWQTVCLSALAGTAALVLAALLVTCAVRLPRRWAVLAVVLSCLPLVVPSSLLATAWVAAFGGRGALHPLAVALLGRGFTVYSTWGAAAALAARYFGVAAMVLLYERLRQQGTWPAERALGIRRTAGWLHLRLRGALPAAAAAWLLVVLLAMNDHVLPGMLLVSTYGTQVLIQYEALQDPAGAASLALPMALACGAMIALAIAAGRRVWTEAESAPTTRLPPASPVERLVAALVVALVLAMTVAGPLAALARQSGSWQALGEGFDAARGQVWETLRLAAIAGPLCAVLAAVLAGHWVRCRREGRATIVPLVLVNLAVPPSLLGIGIIGLTQRWPLTMIRDTAWPMVGGYVVRFLPLAVLLLYTTWRRESPAPALAARVHGVSAWRSALRIAWPRRRAAVLAALAVSALLVATELEVSILLAPAGRSTLGVRLRTMIHTAPERLFAALALDTVLLIAPLIVAAVLLLLGRRRVEVT